MHIQGEIPAIGSADFYGIFSNQPPVDARSPARRRRAAGNDGPASLSPEEIELIDQWTSAAHTSHPEDTPNTGIL